LRIDDGRSKKKRFPQSFPRTERTDVSAKVAMIQLCEISEREERKAQNEKLSRPMVLEGRLSHCAGFGGGMRSGGHVCRNPPRMEQPAGTRKTNEIEQETRVGR